MKFKSETLEQFIERYAVDVSQGGIFIRTKEPQPVGTQMKFEFQLRDGAPLIGGEGTVVWIRELDPARPAVAPGMGVRFDRLADGSPLVLERILNQKSRLTSPSRSSGSKPPSFSESPTRVAQMPMGDEDRETTPLPSPMPFHSDADEFPDEAFEEATKVRSVEDLVAQTAMGTTDLPLPPPPSSSPQIAAPFASPFPVPSSPFSAPTAAPPPPSFKAPAATPPFASQLPVSGEAGNRRSSGLSDDPSEARSTEEPLRTLIDSVPPPPMTPAQASSRTLIDAVSPAGRTLLDAAPPPPHALAPALAPALTPAVAPAREESRPRLEPAVPRIEPMRAREPSRPPATAAPLPGVPAMPMPPRPAESRMSLLIVALVCVLAAAVALVWLLWMKQPAESTIAPRPTPVAKPATTGSASGTAEIKPDVTPPPPPPPAVATVETTIAADAAEATVEVLTTDQHGKAPLVARLEKGKSYSVKVTAPGFMPSEITVIGGSDNKVAVKLDAKARVLQVVSTPGQASVYLDGNPVKKLTPTTIDLNKGQAGRKLRLMVRRVGYQPFFANVKPEDFTEEADRMVFSVNATLTTATRTAPGTGPGPGSDGTKPPGDGGATEGSDSTPSPTPTEPKPTEPKPAEPKPAEPAGSGAATTGEPAPDWTK